MRTELLSLAVIIGCAIGAALSSVEPDPQPSAVPAPSPTPCLRSTDALPSVYTLIPREVLPPRTIALPDMRSERCPRKRRT